MDSKTFCVLLKSYLKRETVFFLKVISNNTLSVKINLNCLLLVSATSLRENRQTNTGSDREPTINILCTTTYPPHVPFGGV